MRPETDTRAVDGNGAAAVEERGRSRRRAAVMADVAKLAGVSHQTVSRVINDSAHVRPETRDRVLEAMRKLDYRPNSVARALVTGRSKTLGVVSFDTTLFGPASTLFGIERAAHDAGYFVSIVSLGRSTARPCAERGRAPARAGRRRDPGHRAAGVGRARLAAAPRATCRWSRSRRARTTARPLVAVDQFDGAALATSTCSSSGTEPSGTSPGRRDWLEAQHRIDGWRATLRGRRRADARRSLRRRLERAVGLRARRDSSRRTDVTAVFAANDPMALGFLRALHEAGAGVPDDISVVGFDDIPEAAYFTPPLTTVRQDFMQLGSSSFALLLEEMGRGTRSSARVTVRPELVVRESTAPPQR